MGGLPLQIRSTLKFQSGIGEARGTVRYITADLTALILQNCPAALG